MKSAYTQAVKDGKLDSNPCNGIARPRGAYTALEREPLLPDEEFRKGHMLSTSDVNEVLGLLDGKFTRFPVYLLKETGLRIGECLALRWRDINFDENYIHVRHTMNNKGELTEPKTKRSKAKVSISPELSNKLRNFLANSVDKVPYYDLFVFTENGQPITPSRFNKLLTSDLKGSRFEAITPHIFRHYRGSYLLPLKGLAATARALRDTQSSVVKVYSHLINDQVMYGS